MQIYLARNNQQAGPYTLEQLNQMLAKPTSVADRFGLAPRHERMESFR